MKTIEIKNANAIQNWGDEEEGGIYIFTSDGGSSGPFVWIGIEGDSFIGHDDEDITIESSTEMSEARKSGMSNEEIFEKFKATK